MVVFSGLEVDPVGRKVRRKLVTWCHFLLFAALSPMFGLSLDLNYSNFWFRHVVCNDLNNLVVTGGLTMTLVGRDGAHKLGIRPICSL